MKEYAIQLDIDPDRKLISVASLRIHWDIGEGFQRFNSRASAEWLMLAYSKWAWQGTSIVEVELEKGSLPVLVKTFLGNPTGVNKEKMAQEIGVNLQGE